MGKTYRRGGSDKFKSRSSKSFKMDYDDYGIDSVAPKKMKRKRNNWDTDWDEDFRY